MNQTLCLVAYLVRAWIYDRNGLGIPADFISFSSQRFAQGVLLIEQFVKRKRRPNQFGALDHASCARHRLSYLIRVSIVSVALRPF
jgi:hypothetical protein